jgi:hypothetical protein
LLNFIRQIYGGASRRIYTKVGNKDTFGEGTNSIDNWFYNGFLYNDLEMAVKQVAITNDEESEKSRCCLNFKISAFALL